MLLILTLAGYFKRTIFGACRLDLAGVALPKLVPRTNCWQRTDFGVTVLMRFLPKHACKKRRVKEAKAKLSLGSTFQRIDLRTYKKTTIDKCVPQQ